jgi:hypothetical protein
MFENTVRELMQIKNTLEEIESLEQLKEDASSSFERDAIEELRELVLQISDLYDRLDNEHRYNQA